MKTKDNMKEINIWKNGDEINEKPNGRNRW